MGLVVRLAVAMCEGGVGRLIGDLPLGLVFFPPLFGFAFNFGSVLGILCPDCVGEEGAMDSVSTGNGTNHL